MLVADAEAMLLTVLVNAHDAGLVWNCALCELFLGHHLVERERFGEWVGLVQLSRIHHHNLLMLVSTFAVHLP